MLKVPAQGFIGGSACSTQLPTANADTHTHTRVIAVSRVVLIKPWWFAANVMYKCMTCLMFSSTDEQGLES